jgi:hypothetical protein
MIATSHNSHRPIVVLRPYRARHAWARSSFAAMPSRADKVWSRIAIRLDSKTTASKV